MVAEGSKGNHGYYLVSDGGTISYRTRIRTPSFAHVQMVPLLCRGLTVPDLVAILGQHRLRARGHRQVRGANERARMLSDQERGEDRGGGAAPRAPQGRRLRGASDRAGEPRLGLRRGGRRRRPVLGMSVEEVDGIATFYDLIFRRPVGRHVVMVCDSVSCWVTGEEKIMEHLQRRLDVAWGARRRTAPSRSCRWAAWAPATRARP